MKKNLLNVLKFLGFLSIGLAILYLIYNKQQKAYEEECALQNIPLTDCSLLDKVWQDFATANYFWIAMVLLVFTISNVSRAIRWNMFLQPLGYKPRLSNSFLSIVLAYFANLGLPRLGEVVRAGSLAQYEKIPVEKVMGTVVLDRIIDVICMLSVTALALVLEYDRIWAFVDEQINLSDKVGGGGRLLLYLCILGLSIVATFYIFRQRIAQTQLYGKVMKIALGFWEGLQSIRQIKSPFWFLFHTVNIWFMYFLVTYLCFFAFEPTSQLGWVAGLVTFVFGGWGIVAPSPGGMGTYHFMVQTSLILYGVNSNDAFSYANIAFFSVQLGCNIILGIIALVLLPYLNRNYRPADRVDVKNSTTDASTSTS